MTKRIKILILVLILFNCTQGIILAQNQIMKFGIRVAPNLGWINPDTKYYSYNGLAGGISLGFVSDINFTEHYALSTGFNFSFLNGNLTYPDSLLYEGQMLDGTMSRKYGFRYIEIPILFKMKTKNFGKFDFFAQVGFGTGFRIKTKAKDNFETTTQGTISDKKSITEQETRLIREAIIVGIGSDFHIDESTFLFFGLSYSNSLNNVLKGYNVKHPDLEARGFLNYAELNVGILF